MRSGILEEAARRSGNPSAVWRVISGCRPHNKGCAFWEVGHPEFVKSGVVPEQPITTHCLNESLREISNLVGCYSSLSLQLLPPHSDPRAVACWAYSPLQQRDRLHGVKPARHGEGRREGISRGAWAPEYCQEPQGSTLFFVSGACPDDKQFQGTDGELLKSWLMVSRSSKEHQRPLTEQQLELRRCKTRCRQGMHGRPRGSSRHPRG